MLKFENKLVYSTAEIAVIKREVLKEIGHFEPPGDLSKLLRKINRGLRFQNQMKPRGLESVYSILSSQKALFAIYKALKIKDDLKAALKPGTLKTCSLKWRLPPMWLLRNFEEYSGEKPNKDDINYARAHDVEPPILSRIIKELSEQYERDVGDFLTKNGIKFKTEAVLAKEQQEKYGRAVATPDFLLDEPIRIAVTEGDTTRIVEGIAWIDAKNYMFIGDKLMTHSLRKQIDKYADYGYGAFVFHYGFVEDCKLNALMLDGSSIGTEN